MNPNNPLGADDEIYKMEDKQENKKDMSHLVSGGFDLGQSSTPATGPGTSSTTTATGGTPVRVMNQDQGGGWFYIIAVLSLVNTVLFIFNANLTFIFGLGITQFIDGFTVEMAKQYGTIFNIIGIGLNLFIAGIFGVLGFFSSKKQNWALITGMVLYGLDALLVLICQDFIGFIVHIIALAFIFQEYRSASERAKTSG